MHAEFGNEPRDRAPLPATDEGARQPVSQLGEHFGNEFGGDPLDFAKVNDPPKGLMRKRPPFVVWILAALLLGGLIALVLVALSSD
jgi:hypothetical protein